MDTASVIANSSLLSAALGGVLIGTAATWLYLSLGRIAGISGIAAQALSGAAWPLTFIAGLAIGGWGATLLTADSATAFEQLPSQISALSSRWPWLIAGGALVGYGTRLGSGCTSGHGVCGIARFSKRSLTATCVFVGVGMVTATLIAALRGSVA